MVFHDVSRWGVAAANISYWNTSHILGTQTAFDARVSEHTIASISWNFLHSMDISVAYYLLHEESMSKA